MAPKGTKMKDMTAEEWNKEYPEGTRVRYWSVRGDPSFIDSETRSIAWEIGDGTPIVKINGQAGGVALSHLLVLDPPIE